MKTNDQNPLQNQSNQVIDLTEDSDHDDVLELLDNTLKSTSQDSGLPTKVDSPPLVLTNRINDVNQTTVIKDSIQITISASVNESNTCDTNAIDFGTAESSTASVDDTIRTDNLAVAVDSSTQDETTTIVTGEHEMEMDDETTTNETKTLEDTTMDVNADDTTEIIMEDVSTDSNFTTTSSTMMAMYATTGDTTTNMDDSHTDTETGYQPYSIYRYEWANNTSTFTCLASTQDRYNITTSQSLALDQAILKKSMNPNHNTAPINNNFFKSCHWSPDGTCLLTSSEDRMIRLFDIPSSIYDPSQSESLALAPSLGILEGESICDMTWFPSMNSQDPSTCCFLSSVRDHPVRLWDATTGKVRASYCVVDHQERFIGPNVLKFNLDGTKIYCGYENMIEIFDVHSPGNNTSTKLNTTPHRKSRKGQKGIISCLDFNPDLSGMYAAGSYSQSIGIYDEKTNDLCLKLTGMKGGGVTQVKFSVDGHLLYSACRQSNTISCWDVRQSGNVLYELDRKGKTNQRIMFDLDPTGSVLITGDQDGHVLAYDLTTMDSEDVETKPRLLSSWDAHQDVVSGATFNPGYPSVMATCSGQRKFEIEQSDSDSDSEDMVVDNTLKIWQLAGQYEWYSMDMGTAAENMELDITQ